MTHSAAMASEILPGRTLLEALNTDLVCDAINTAMRELFLQIVYGRTQSAFSEDGLPIGAGLEDLGKGLRSQVGTMYGTLKKGPRYLEMAEGYVTGIALDEEGCIIGYQFVSLGKMTDFIKQGDVCPASVLKTDWLDAFDLIVYVQTSIFCDFLCFFQRSDSIAVQDSIDFINSSFI